ncbi:tRNA (N6-threonylcarbamoyladenosine(37)-N6)-methyltransferase TrmO [Thermogladius sp. 4427co]|uniref:tRNA (N6-threonylcarbamoyladenosine(37)-N6)-methyltransferase TrmO n=1 Tax=Thermogladius sp. 4427co TaxID=3450718 RepID=UPI003F7A8D95
MEYCFKPIGFVRHGFSDEQVKESPGGVPGYIEVVPEYAEGLLNLEGFSHIIVVSVLHKVGEAERRVLRVRHRRLKRFGIPIDDLPEVGVFATDSPHRPNPIAISILKVNRIEGNRVYVENLDLFDGTPVLDIKPYDRGRLVEDIKLPWWAEELERRIREKLGKGPRISP